MRAVLGAAALVQGIRYLGSPSEFFPGILAVAAGVSLIVGLLTPASAILASLLVTSCRFWPQAIEKNLFESPSACAFAITLAIGVFLLGPGAYSLDARLFGPREIVIPPIHHPPR